MNFRDDNCSHVGIDGIHGQLKLFSENIEYSIAPYESDQRYVAVRNVIDLWYPGVWSKGNWFELIGCYDFQRRLSLETAIAVMFVMKPLEVLALSFEHSIA